MSAGNASTIAIIAGTGRTGKWALKAALVRGYQVRLLARSPNKVDTVLKAVFPAHTEAEIETMKTNNLTIIAGGIGDMAKLQELFTGADCIMSFLGMLPDKKAVMGPGVENILNAASSMPADAKKPARFLHMSSIALSESKGQANGAWGYLPTFCILQCFLKKCFDDMQDAEDIITHARDNGTAPCKITIARPTVLDDEKNYFRDYAERAEEGGDEPLDETHLPYTLLKVGDKGKMTFKIDRQHVAEAFLDIYADGSYENENVSLFTNAKCKNPKAEAVSAEKE